MMTTNDPGYDAMATIEATLSSEMSTCTANTTPPGDPYTYGSPTSSRGPAEVTGTKRRLDTMAGDVFTSSSPRAKVSRRDVSGKSRTTVFNDPLYKMFQDENQGMCRLRDELQQRIYSTHKETSFEQLSYTFADMLLFMCYVDKKSILWGARGFADYLGPGEGELWGDINDALSQESIDNYTQPHMISEISGRLPNYEADRFRFLAHYQPQTAPGELPAYAYRAWATYRDALQELGRMDSLLDIHPVDRDLCNSNAMPAKKPVVRAPPRKLSGTAMNQPVQNAQPPCPRQFGGDQEVQDVSKLPVSKEFGCASAGSGSSSSSNNNNNSGSASVVGAPPHYNSYGGDHSGLDFNLNLGFNQELPPVQTNAVVHSNFLENLLQQPRIDDPNYLVQFTDAQFSDCLDANRDMW